MTIRNESKQTVALSCYKLYQRQTPGGVPMSMLGSLRVDCEISHVLQMEMKHY